MYCDWTHRFTDPCTTDLQIYSLSLARNKVIHLIVFGLFGVVTIGEVWFKDNLSETAPWVKVDVRKNAHKSEMYKRVTLLDGDGNMEV